MALRYQFFRPLAFLTIKGPTLHVYRLVLPLVATGLCVAAYVALPQPVDLVGDKSASDYLSGFFATLPGFFIAALAAVASFNGGDLDKDMPGVTVTMVVNGDKKANEITLRVFLCYLFAYLTVLSFLGFFVCIGGALVAPSVVEWLGPSGPAPSSAALYGAQIGFVALMSLLAASVVFCTIQGLYFLAERVHQKLIP